MITLKTFANEDAAAVNRVALAAFRQYAHEYTDWPGFAARIGTMSRLADHAKLIVATVDHDVAGAVAYVPADAAKADFFDTSWPVLRMLVVDPAQRGLGIGRALTQACIQQAVADEAPVIALHTSPIMQVALAMYQRMGFIWRRSAPPIHGVPYAVYIKTLD